MKRLKVGDILTTNSGFRVDSGPWIVEWLDGYEALLAKVDMTNGGGIIKRWRFIGFIEHCYRIIEV